MRPDPTPRPTFSSASTLALSLALALGALVACGGQSGPRARLAIGEKAPSFELKGLDGKRLESSSLRGKPVVLSFWATWCGPCLHEIPALTEIHADSSVAVVTVALDDGGEAVVRPFADEKKLAYPVLLGDDATFRRFGGLSLPYTLVLDAQGTVVAIHRGVADAQTLRTTLDRLRPAASSG